MLSGRPLPSVFEYLGYQGARAAGLGEGESQIIGALTPAALSVAFAGLAGWLNAGRAAPSRLFVYLTEEQYQEVVNAGRLGKGYRGWWRVFGPPFDEGRVWATTYTPEQMKGISVIFRAMSAGIEPWRLSKLTRVIEIGEEAAGAFGTPFGPGFSLNPIGWGKGILGNQWQFRGTLAFAGSPITSLAGYGSYTTGQMIVFRMGELLRFGIYTGTPVATAIAIDRYFKPY